jgi:enoyl-CoA hydratase
MARSGNRLISTFYTIQSIQGCALLTLTSTDGMNRLSRACVSSLLEAIDRLRMQAEEDAIRALIITGNDQYFSAGADLNEISRLTGLEGFALGRLGQSLTLAIDRFPAPAIACVRGYCLGGGLDLALACDVRIAAPNAVFGHRGTTLGLITGWGGTQRLPRLIGRARALEMFLMAQKIPADRAFAMGLADAIAEDPRALALRVGSSGTIHLSC